MKLFFCDICNESIPLQDIKENRSTTIKGKIFCRGCNPLNELGGPDTPSGGGGGGSSAFLTVLVLALGGAVGYLYYELKFAPDTSEPVISEERVASIESTLDDMKMVLKGIQAAYDGLEELRGLPEQIQSLRDEGAGRSKELTRLATEMNAVQEQLVAVGNLRDRVEGMALRQDEASNKIDSALAAVDGLQNSVQELGARPPVIVERGGAGVASVDEGSVLPDEELLSIIERLGSDEPMTRWEAVDQIRRRKDATLAGHIMPLLDDRDTFVRAQAIYTLGELKADKAVAKLIKLLRDDESMISEEALTSLVVITGQNFKFDVNGSKAVRDKGIKRWEEWLGKNRDRYGS